jgi:hypothetical protein
MLFGAVIRRALPPAALRKALPRSVGDAVASRAPRVWPIRSLEGGLPPLFGDDGRGFASSRVRAPSRGAGSPARPRPRRVQRARRPPVLPCPMDPRCPAELLGRAESPGQKTGRGRPRLSTSECPPLTIVAAAVGAVEGDAARQAIARASRRGQMWIAGADQVTVRAMSTGQCGSREAIPTGSTATATASAASKKLSQNSS